jgi:pimeloyl-ACP methyl ester carboxylesterase
VNDSPEGGSTRRQVSRRSILLAGATGGVVIGALGGIASLAGLLDEQAPQPKTQDVTTVDRVYSKARGREIDLVTILPATSSSDRLPVCLFLHGLHANARHATPSNLGRQLIAHASRGAIRPFAFVAVDGGDNYWHENHSGDNSMAMLLDEIPGWLAERNLGDANGIPFACAGVSMGGFGALLYARRRNERGNPLNAVAAISPGLLMSWREMSTRKAFRDREQWAALDPLRNVGALGTVPVGMWCGTEDHFIDGVRKFIALAKPEVGYTGPGTHGDAFYRGIVPSVLAFLGRHTPR